MSFFNYIPGVAHVKAGIHLLCNDKEGAANTMETFHTKTPIVSHLVAGIAKVAGDDKLAKKAWDGGNSSLNALPVVGHVKGVGHFICGDIEGCEQAMKDATITTLNIADGIPVVGHAKGAIHYVCGDVDGGHKAMKAATRTTAVMAAGAGGFVVGGPVGAVAGGVTAGSGWDVTTAAVTNGKEVNGIAKIIENPTSVDSYFDAGLSVVGDGVAGYSGGKIAQKAMGPGKPGGSSGASGIGGEHQAAAAQQLVDDLNAGKISFTEYQQKWDAMKPNAVPVKVNAEQLNFYYEKGFIAEQQYNQAMGEMTRTGSNQATVAMTSSNEGLGNKSSNNEKEQNQKGDKDNNSKDNQPPQQPVNTNRTSTDESRILFLRRRLTELLNSIRFHRDQDPMLLDRQFQRDYFQEIFSIVSELISSGHIVYISSDDLILVVATRDGSWWEAIEYQVADYLDVHDQLIHQREFPLDLWARCRPCGRIPCPTVLSAEFQQGSQLVLSPHVNYTGRPSIYGARCRLCHRRDCASNISYVGQTERSPHLRVCGEHCRAARDLINERANEEQSADRPMYEHVAEHFENGEDIPEGTAPRDAFRQVMDVILLPISDAGPDQLDSWEAFWQFFFHCRRHFWGWSRR